MTRHFLTALAAVAALSVAGCAHQSPSQIAEVGDTEASDAYVGIATSLNAYEQVPGANVAAAEALKLKAWQALLAERQTYATTGQVVLTAISAIVADVHTLTGK
jgi:predicted outer membrane protein